MRAAGSRLSHHDEAAAAYRGEARACDAHAARTDRYGTRTLTLVEVEAERTCSRLIG
jgi:hypothetical protein